MKELKTIQEVEEIKHNDLCVLIAKTRDCSVCKPVSTRLETLLSDYPEIPLYSIYVDEMEEFRGQYLVFTVPTVLILQNGKEILRESRFVEFKNIKRLLDLYLS